MNTLARTCLMLGLAVLFCGGCAPTYRSYASNCISCRYCPPPPLPFCQYDPCVCHSCPATAHLSAAPPEQPRLPCVETTHQLP